MTGSSAGGGAAAGAVAIALAAGGAAAGAVGTSFDAAASGGGAGAVTGKVRARGGLSPNSGGGAGGLNAVVSFESAADALRAEPGAVFSFAMVLPAGCVSIVAFAAEGVAMRGRAPVTRGCRDRPFGPRFPRSGDPLASSSSTLQLTSTLGRDGLAGC